MSGERAGHIIASAEQNPEGLHRRYIVSRADGSPVDPSAVYFVLRLDSGGSDATHIAACRAAARAYWEFIRLNDPHGSLGFLGADLQMMVEAMEVSDER